MFFNNILFEIEKDDILNEVYSLVEINEDYFFNLLKSSSSCLKFPLLGKVFYPCSLYFLTHPRTVASLTPISLLHGFINTVY